MVGRNDPCSCGSGEKYKKCCGREEAVDLQQVIDTELGRILSPRCAKYSAVTGKVKEL